MVPGEMPNFVDDDDYRKLLAFGSIGTLRVRLMKSGKDCFRRTTWSLRFSSNGRTREEAKKMAKDMTKQELLETSLIQAVCYDRNLEEVQRIANEAPELFTHERSLGSQRPSLHCSFVA